MLIANPIYDAVFKYLLEDFDIAKGIISTIIGEEIIELEFLPQERSATSEKHLLTVYRVDFKAVIKTANGTHKKVLIELQKGKQPIDVMRFRRYLGDNYSKTDELKGQKEALPIITIYFLGFKLSLKYAVIKIGRNYVNVANGEVIDGKDDFAEKLTHDSYIVQIPYLPEQTQSKVEEILSVFNQTRVLKSEEWILNYKDTSNDELLRKIVNRLSNAAASEEVQYEIESEEYFEHSLDAWVRKNNEKLFAKDEVIAEKDKELAEKEQEIEQMRLIIEKLSKQK